MSGILAVCALSGQDGVNGHGKCDTNDNETCYARFPLMDLLAIPLGCPKTATKWLVISSSLGETTSHSTKLQKTAAKSLVTPVGERWGLATRVSR